MINRVWDPENKYIDAFLKEYSHWVVDISFRQHTLGCFIIFAKRSVQKISELTTDELIDLRDVMLAVETALTNTPEMMPDRFNYLQLGNNLNHLHFHGIPRYKSPRRFAGQEWLDLTWGHPPTWTRQATNKSVVLEIRKKLEEKL